LLKKNSRPVSVSTPGTVGGVGENGVGVTDNTGATTLSFVQDAKKIIDENVKIEIVNNSFIILIFS
jgi:hypothetical protein